MRPSDWNPFAEWLDRAVRTRRTPGGDAWLTQRVLADAIDVGPSYISQIISGKRRPSAEVVIRIANYLGEDANHLLQIAGHTPIDDAPNLSDSDNPSLMRLYAAIKVLLSNETLLSVAVQHLEGLANEARSTRKTNKSATDPVKKQQG